MAFLIWLQSKALGRLQRGAWLLAGAIGLCACTAEVDCLKSNGSVVTHRRAVDRRTRTVLVYDNVDLTIVPDTATYAEVRAGEHVIDGLTLTYQDARTLVLNNTNRCNWARSYDTPYEVRLHVPHLTDVRQLGYGLVSTASRWTQDTLFVHLLGAGDVQLDLTSKYLYADMYELGDMTLNGTADEFHALVGGTGFLLAGGLATRSCFFETTRTSIGDAHVQTTQHLGGTVAGKGTLYYTGSPSSLDIKGMGKVVRQ
ncbi:GIN domain-containing protein [Hymenobacter bucti]|uniref:GIN domain-containing protein n=1 Tax=Hymenobacter bucti TaxID=1844114 RepID=A0ABW4QSK4_9BACT